MQITTSHPSSSYGVPVILNDIGDVMNYAPGIKAAREKLGLTTRELGELCGFSERTVTGWESGRMPEISALNMIGKLLEAKT